MLTEISCFYEIPEAPGSLLNFRYTVTLKLATMHCFYSLALIKQKYDIKPFKKPVLSVAFQTHEACHIVCDSVVIAVQFYNVCHYN